jgi:hypothetical protein
VCITVYIIAFYQKIETSQFLLIGSALQFQDSILTYKSFSLLQAFVQDPRLR